MRKNRDFNQELPFEGEEAQEMTQKQPATERDE